MGRFHTLTVAAVEPLTEDSVALTFEVPDDLAGEFDFVPGQSLTLRRTDDGRDERRQYSICAPAGDAPRIGVREIPDGLFSSWLVHRVRPGERIEVLAPSGRFCPDPALLSDGRHLGIAAGSGITPMISVLGTALANGGEATLLYGNRTSASVMFVEELADLKNLHGPRLQLVHVLSREPRDVELFSGRLDADRLRRLLTTLAPVSRFDHVWLCGPHAMLDDALHPTGRPPS
jgi:ring-1,2-phenylacetyl-CoA epoxidase subunit PaaE